MSESTQKLFNRYAKLEFIFQNDQNENIGNLTLTKDDIDFEATISLNRSNNSNKANITIFNLKEDIKSKLIKNTLIRIEAGYAPFKDGN